MAEPRTFPHRPDRRGSSPVQRRAGDDLADLCRHRADRDGGPIWHGALQRLTEVPVPDVILLDLHLPDVTGMDGLIRLRQAAGEVPVVVVSSLADARVISAAMAAGAAGFVPKHSQREIFRAAFAALREGRRFTPEGYQQGAGAGEPGENETIARLRSLTRQQAVILQRICAGKANKVIAWELSVAETTVKAHVTAIMRKLGVTSRTQAVLMATGVNFDALLGD